jgi:hypothetical protein
MTVALNPAQARSVARIAGLTIANALVFQEVLAGHEPRVKPVQKSLAESDLITEFSAHWKFIVDEIDYVPIFSVARDLLLELSGSPEVDAGLRFLAEQALRIVRRRAALRHDLMGRIYHRLLVEAKYLGTYYTSVPAATLLLKLTLAPQRWPRDWADLDALSEFHIADLACGTGTLLMAAAETLTDNYVRSSINGERLIDLPDFHRRIIEKMLYGYDVLPSAVHLTASTLALRASEVAFDLTHLWSLPLGGEHHRLGSIEFLKERGVHVTRDLFGGAVAPGQITAAGNIAQQAAELPDLDVCVMNPPFVRSVGGNLLFGSAPPEERRPMQAELARLLRAPGVLANSTAGLGAVFVAAGDSALKPGGRMALVLPKALLSGVAWEETRRLIGLRYQLEFLVVSHDPHQWNFSENTSLSEVLVVARKLSEGEPLGPVTVLNLWQNPTTAVEALSVAQSLLREPAPDILAGQGCQEVRIGAAKAGEALTLPWAAIRGRMWMAPCAFAQSELVRATLHLLQGQLYQPGIGIKGELPLAPLRQFGVLGPDRRDIHDGFAVTDAVTAFPCVWGHDAAKNVRLVQPPNRYLAPHAAARPGRPLRRVALLWPRAGRVLIPERLRLNTQRVAAVRSPEAVLANVWWPFAVTDQDEQIEKALTLWLNSTLGLLVLLAHRLETEGAWVDFKKPVLHNMPVLDFRALSPPQLGMLAQAFDGLGDRELRPFPQMNGDDARGDIDRVFAQVLRLPDVSGLRWLLAREPVVCVSPLARAPVVVNAEGDLQLPLLSE